MPIKQQILSKAAKLKTPVSGVFELTPRCNLNCKMCYVRMSAEEVAAHGGEISIDDWIRICDEAYDNGLLYLLLTGGEVFLLKDFERLYRHAYEKGIVLSINSNGSMINDEHIKMLVSMPPERINITIYGDSAEKYGELCGNPAVYDKVLENVLKLKANNIRVSLNCSVTKLNVNSLDNIIRFAETNGLPLNIATYMFPPVRSGCSQYDSVRLTAEECGILRARLDYNNKRLREKNMQIIENGESIKRSLSDCPSGTTCMAGRSSYWITWKKQMCACCMFEQVVDYEIGKFSETWNKLVQETNLVTYPKECKDCKKNGLCNTCAAVNYAESGRFDGVAEYFCRMTDAYIEEFRKLEGK